MYDSIIVGCGFAGAVMAQRLAEKGQKVLVIDKRAHVGGNCYDTEDEYGICIHVYGPHIFHTTDKGVYEYLSRFTEWYDYSHEVVAKVDDGYIPVPFNLNTLKLVFPEKEKELAHKLISRYGMDTKVPILKLMESEDEDIQSIAGYVYDNIFLKYTMKQWGQTPKEIDPSVTGRVPVYISYDNRYFQDKYQGMPLNGFTALFNNMLADDNITVKLNMEASEIISLEEDGIYCQGNKFLGNVIYTGPIDELFNEKFGMLPYRTLDFVTKHYEEDSILPKAVVNYTVSEDYTRITEYKKLTGQKHPGSTIMMEYSHSYEGKESQIPYYAIINEKNTGLYELYKKEADKYNNLYMLGRLAEYKYYNIDAIVRRALDLADKLM